MRRRDEREPADRSDEQKTPTSACQHRRGLVDAGSTAVQDWGLVSGGGLPLTASGSNTTRQRRTGAGCQPRACVDGPWKSCWPPHAWSTVEVGAARENARR
jgi:hypothetical protein